MELNNILIILSVVLNLAASIVNVRAARRNRRVLASHREEYSQAIAFAAFMASKEVAAPPHIRELARSVLPSGVTDIEVKFTHIADTPETLH